MSRDTHSHGPHEPREPESHESEAVRDYRVSPLVTATRTAAKDVPGENDRDSSRGVLRKPESHDSPQAYSLRERTYFVRDSEITTLAEIGTFRVVPAHDLARYGYAGDSDRMEREVRRLKDQRLVSEKSIGVGPKKTVRVFTLTKAGKRLLQKSGRLSEDQSVYHGLVKPREAKHDADLYRVYHTETARIERDGGRPLRAVLDYELKRNLNHDLAALGPDSDRDEARARVAEKHGLSVVNGKIQIPDLRVEYEDAESDRRHIDLELATRNYRPRALAEKAKAGFSIYAPREDASRLRRILDEREITAGILSL